MPSTVFAGDALPASALAWPTALGVPIAICVACCEAAYGCWKFGCWPYGQQPNFQQPYAASQQATQIAMGTPSAVGQANALAGNASPAKTVLGLQAPAGLRNYGSGGRPRIVRRRR